MEAWTYAMKEETYGLAIEAGKRAARLNEGPGQDQPEPDLVRSTGPPDDFSFWSDWMKPSTCGKGWEHGSSPPPTFT